jgi:hypothetical protein
MRLLLRVQITQQNHKPRLNRSSHQTELPLPSQRANHPLPEEVTAECRQLIAQLLRAVLLAEKEAENEH